MVQSEKGRDLTQFYDKSPYTDRKIQKVTWQHNKKATKNFDNTTIADRLRTVSWGNDSHPTGVVFHKDVKILHSPNHNWNPCKYQKKYLDGHHILDI